jgi:tetratricopeptide (TPR) repeat protein/predicted Ser/Thr protein kinase
MTPQDYERVRELFLATREKAPGQRAAFLCEACHDDDVRAEVESLLEHAEQADTFLQTPALGGSFALAGPEALASGVPSSNGLSDQPPHPATPERIGGYRILAVLGRGGMGVVYRAEQENPRRTVALKVVRWGADSPALLQRFQNESQVLGYLHHPGIAQILEAGTADTGRGPQPYFAMEFIAGRPLTEQVEAQRLGVRARIELLVKVCDAVQHAHQKGVIHRDLKPGNILVDERGQPKILDFGVARVIDPDLRVSTIATHAGLIVGTLGYMSPEQVQGQPNEIDIRTDVYSLGAILYELLAQRPPLAVSGQSLPEAARVIMEDEPKVLHTLCPGVAGDLEAIVSKALEKDKNRRYASAAALADDLRRFLADQPVSARPATTWYQFRKFARRNTTLVVSAAALFLALVLGIAGTTYGLVQATSQRRTAESERNRAVTAEQLAEERLAQADQQRTEAQRQAAIARAVNAFLNDDLLASADPDLERQRDVTVREVLDRAAQTIGDRFADQPLVEAAIRRTLGDAYEGLGEYLSSATHMQRALDLLLTTLGERDPSTLVALSRLGWLRSLQGQYAEAESLLTRAVELRRQVHGASDSRTLGSQNHLAVLYGRQGRGSEQEMLLLNILAVADRDSRSARDNIATAQANLAELYIRQHRETEAEPLLLAALDLSRQLHGPTHPSTLSTMNSLVMLYTNQGRWSEGEVLGLRTLELRRQVLGEEHPRTLTSMTTLAVLYKRQGRFDDAEVLCLQTLAIKRRVLGAEHPDTLVALNNLGSLYATAGCYAEAEPLYLQALEIRQRVLGARHRATVSSLRNLVELYSVWGKTEEAARWQAHLPATESTHPANPDL